MHIYLVLLCLLSVVRVTQGYSQFPCADRNGPRYCAKAKQCRPCVALMCMTEKNRDLFKLMCCDSDAARHLCNGLCENSGSTTLIRYDADKKERALLCPADQIIFKCKSCRPCSEMMCSKDVLKEVFKQQCFPKLNYDQLKSSECKDLAHKYNKSTLSMVTDDLKPSSPAKISGITTSSAVDSYKPETSSSSNPTKTPAYQTTTDAFSTTTSSYPTTTSAYQTTTPAYQTTFEHFYNGLFVTLGVISALIGTFFSLAGFILCDRKYNRSGISLWCLSHCKLPDKREEKNKEEQELLLSEIEKTNGLQKEITALKTTFDEMVISKDKSTKELESTIKNLEETLRTELHSSQKELEKDHLKHDQAQTQRMDILKEELLSSQVNLNDKSTKQLESTINNLANLVETLRTELHFSKEEQKQNNLNQEVLHLWMMDIVQKCEGTKGQHCGNLHQNLENAEAQQHYVFNTVRNRKRGQFINQPSGPQDS
ncbi:uncharacterized protein LOC128224266 [Mya arenaria]|uniref:uncharacterized protein LOC128224266 n=1 Tax=Mya arenaria TaxID=6604 RepID=UPI0022E56CB2|nr:uncharacterized protein LOC128224266 [Mya arenaria]